MSRTTSTSRRTRSSSSARACRCSSALPRLPGLSRESAVRGGAAGLALQRARGGAAALARDVASVDALRARALARALALADVFDLLADEFARDGAGRLTGARFSARVP